MAEVPLTLELPKCALASATAILSYLINDYYFPEKNHFRLNYSNLFKKAALRILN
jgi:hypothetical protein